MKKIKMVGLDLDGTTFNDQKQISVRNQEAIERAVARGVVVLPATGRMMTGLPKAMTDIPGIIYAVTCNGGAVYDLRTKTPVYEDCIPNWQAAEIVQMLLDMGELPEVYIDGSCYAHADGYERIFDYGIEPELMAYIKVSRIKVDDLVGFLRKSGKGVHKIHVMFDRKNLQRRDAAFAAMQWFDGLLVSSAMPYNMEINSATADKGSALLGLGKILGIEKDEIMAVGDAANDLPMLEKAGFSVAMGNASDEVKKVCDAVTLTNQEDGVAAALEKWVLQ